MKNLIKKKKTNRIIIYNSLMYKEFTDLDNRFQKIVENIIEKNKI